MGKGKIVIRGARQHNLKNIDLEIPRDTLTVITGVSGSGKSSLAFDTIYAEGQRRYIESLSAYARQFLERMDKPDVDYIEGLSPAISIEQKGASKNPRSTVATMTEIHDYLRLLFARIGVPHCHICGTRIERQTVGKIVDALMDHPEGTAVTILGPVVRGQKGEHRRLLEDLRKQGFARVRIDGEIVSTDQLPGIDKNRRHSIEVVVDSLKLRAERRARIAESVQSALGLGSGLAIVLSPKGESLFSDRMACPRCGVGIEELETRMFSFNSPFGACRECSGLGVKMEIDADLVIPDPRKSVLGGAIAPFSRAPDTWFMKTLRSVADHYGFRLNEPIKQLSDEQRSILLYGSGEERVPFRIRSERGGVFRFNKAWEGVLNRMKRRYVETDSDDSREWYQQFLSRTPCPACGGRRLRPESLGVKIAGLSIAEVAEMSVSRVLEFFGHLKLSEKDELISRQVLKEITGRLRFLFDVGVEYLTLDRATGTLSGGEAERIQLATQIGSSLVGVLYILDEPSIGLHQRDNKRLIDTLKGLRDLGNTVLVVEHDEQMIRSADFVVDLGPGAGEHGGSVVCAGPVHEVANHPTSLTGQYLSGRKRIPVPRHRRRGNGKRLIIRGARENNLKNLDVAVPLGKFICVTGVSGSGKSTLVDEILYRALARKLHGARERPGDHDSIEGLELLDKVIIIDQSPIGRTPRSNPVTYTGAFTPIRELFARLPESRARGYTPGRFSFNVKGGRCGSCSGDGIIKLKMHFLPDVYVPCEECRGKRYNRETLEIRFKGKNIREVLEMTMEEAHRFFRDIPKIERKLRVLCDVGLGYMRLGQPATTLSGGEAQRVKLATELGRMGTGNTLYLLDEPTTGLHFADIHKLLDVLGRLVDAGNTVVVIEHNLDVVKMADHVIDLGPEGGDEGGRIIAEGTPEDIAASAVSYTGQFLRSMLKVAPEAVQQHSKASTAATAGKCSRAGRRPPAPGR